MILIDASYLTDGKTSAKSAAFAKVLPHIQIADEGSPSIVREINLEFTN